MKYLFITKIRGIRDLLSEDGLAAEIKENMPLYLEKGSHPEMIYAGNDEKKWYIIRSPNDYLSRQAAQASQASSDVSDAAKSDVAKEIEEMIKFGRRITGETETPQKAKPESVEEAVKRIKVEDFNVQLNKISKGR